MSAMPIALLLTTAATGAVGVAVLRSIQVLRRQVAALHTELAESRAVAARGLVPAARTTADAAEIRAAVAEALAEERERELAEARAFWAAQEARDASDAPLLLGLPDSELYLPRQADFAGLEPVAEPGADADETAGDSPELAAARVELTDVRPGPLGTLDVYVFADGTTLCMTPGHRETADRLAAALRAGDVPVLLGGSGVSGAYALTFACGGETVYVLADRVIASL